MREGTNMDFSDDSDSHNDHRAALQSYKLKSFIAHFLKGGWNSRSGMWLMIGTVLVVAGKALDRAPAVLAEDYGIMLFPMMGHYADAFEEGLEMIHPLILAWSVLISQMERRYLS